MSGYLMNFIVYTAAMIGVIVVAVLVYKNMSVAGNSQSKFLSVEDKMSLAPRKSIYVIRAGNERFLVAADAEKTSLISKLDEGQNPIKQNKSSVDDLPVIVDFQRKKETTSKSAQQVLKNIVNNKF